MSRMTDFTVPSTVPGRTLHAFCCEPEGEVRAVLQLSHGMVEYIDRYRPLAEYLADRGILVTGHDHLGHGESAASQDDWGFFEEEHAGCPQRSAQKRDQNPIKCICH
mgnify:CR=1 FL=1